ncbi:hypothetical protein [Marinobacter persicus]|jgi:hypothetical protein|uniref:Uncharacterized protein n=1 Tax=Marinobacter persicus TaxID=930118 RepID=A0A2S6G566_9GAMM|nr:hypothetical protein [Marinobacter persicus]KXS54483.1 MAG: hypothetical protein AWU57_1143 [Marinobacter sp. T13-3]PPK50799.1 hypothetical protein BY455_12049 [Marinobacter persicus]PPK54251.1 hypothetical protein B0H24_101749 [Marinobacter persicus]PPK57387.1 hypothetical protein BY454_12149 [Marinobacter persicus]
MTKAHKAANQEGFLLCRKLRVNGLDDNQWHDLIEKLNDHPCVDFAERKPKDLLEVTYDGTHWSTEELLDAIKAHGGWLTNSWWLRRKLAWYRFTDENVRANAKHKPFCCSKIPPMKK